MSQGRKLLLFIGAFIVIYFLPVESMRFQEAFIEAFALLRYYAREHVLFCLIPAFFIAGAIANFISQGAIIKYFGQKAKKWVSYSIASVSGIVLAVCSCTVLPLFAGIYQRGAGIGPAVAFLYSGPAINVLAIILTARVLGWQLGLARAVGAIVFAVIIGLLMAFFFRKEDQKRLEGDFDFGDQDGKPLGQRVAFLFNLVLILIFAAWTRPEDATGLWLFIAENQWVFAGFLLVILGWMLLKWFDKEEIKLWVGSTWDFAQQILPLLFAGVFIAGFLMGRPESEAGLIPAHYIESLVGGNSLIANLIASVLGAFMYFATLTEVPILQGLLGSGMGNGPALALLLAGPALSLPNMLVIHSVLGTKKTLTFVALVVIMATIAGMVYGNIIV